MKVKLIVLFIISISISICAHKQHVHQYLTRESYYQLRDYLGHDIPIMLSHLDNGPVGPSWSNGTLLAGVWVEDEYDAVYQYQRDSFLAWIPEPFLSWIFGNDADKVYVSITHFWDADNGDNTENNFRISSSGLTYDTGPFPNAYTKASLYKNGGYILKLKFLPYLRVQAANGDWLQFWSVPNYGFEAAGLMYYNLIDLYKNKRMHTNFAYNVYNRTYNERLHDWVNYYGDVYITEEIRDKLVWEILGRIAHLLQDLSEPTHAHIDEHGAQIDPYEEWISGGTPDRYLHYNHNNIQPGIIDPYQSTDPLHFLMYTTQQISDHFASRGPYNGDGDNNLGGNPEADEIAYLNGIGLNNLGGRMDMHNINYNNYLVPTTPAETAELENIRDKTIPNIIRATAGLLYWFATEAGIMPPPPLSVSISGPTTAPCGTGTWTANVSGGYSPYSYQWYHTFTAGGGETTTTKIGKIPTPDRPIDSWWPVGTNSPTLNYYLCGGDSKLKVDVTDNAGTFVSAEYYVAGSEGGGPLLSKNSSDSFEELKKVPRIYNLGQNYPNPFNPSTQIKYALKQDGFVTIKVYDLLGKVVATLVDDNKSAGFYTINFDASSLSSGIYFYTIKTNDYFDRKKMILLK